MQTSFKSDAVNFGQFGHNRRPVVLLSSKKIARVVGQFGPAIKLFYYSCFGEHTMASELFNCLLEELSSPGVRLQSVDQGRYRKLAFRYALKLARVCRSDELNITDEERMKRFDFYWKEHIDQSALLDLGKAETETGIPYKQLVLLSRELPHHTDSQLFQLNTIQLNACEFQKHLSDSRMRYRESIALQIIDSLHCPTVDEVKDECSSLGIFIHR